MHVDFDTPEAAAQHHPIIQLVFHFDRQNYISLLGNLETDHVIPAAQLARALLEESIRWEWMTDEPDPRIGCLFGEFRKSVDAIRAECAKLGRDPEPFTNPSIHGDTTVLGPYVKGTGFPPISTMVDQIEDGAKKNLAKAISYADIAKGGTVRDETKTVTASKSESCTRSTACCLNSCMGRCLA